MTRITNTLLVYVLTPLITIILAALRLPWVEQQKKLYPALLDFLGWFAIAGTAAVYYFSILIPYRKYEISKARKYKAIEELVRTLDTDYPNLQLSVNIMLVKRRFFYWIEPSKKNPKKKKFSLTGKVFQFADHFGKAGINTKLKITVNQGVCGAAYRDGTNISKEYIKSDVLLSGISPGIDSNFTEKQKMMTKDLAMVISCPLIVKEKDGDHQKVKKIGVLNIESKNEESASLFIEKNKEQRDALYEKALTFAKIFVILHV